MRAWGRMLVAAVVAIGLSAPLAADPQLDAYLDALAAEERQDFDSYIRLIRPLAEQGMPLAESGLGSAYLAGHGVPQDRAMAAAWFEKAADHGYPLAQMFIGNMYARGMGIPRDPVKAYMWLSIFSRSRFAGPPSTMSNDDLAAAMTADQLAEAQRLVREWRPKALP